MCEVLIFRCAVRRTARILRELVGFPAVVAVPDAVILIGTVVSRKEKPVGVVLIRRAELNPSSGTDRKTA